MEMRELTKEELTAKLESVGSQILCAARDELYIGMRFLDVALCSFRYTMNTQVSPFGTDGAQMFFNPQELGSIYKRDRILMNRGYLHMVLHCIFRHWERNNVDKRVWNLACDMAVEHLMDSMQVRCIRHPQNFLRKEWYHLLEMKYKDKVLHAQRISRYLLEADLSEEQWQKLENEFYSDDHQFWEDEQSKKNRSSMTQRWKDMAGSMETDMETFSKEAAKKSGDFLGQVKVANHHRRSYRDFLKKFMVLREEMTIDDDTFDYISYTYGLSMYGNMPLIEPMETKEVKKIRDFVIVLDTSMSCSQTLVRKFLEETYHVLTEEESFFQKMNLHILQCDEKVLSDEQIHEQKELHAYMKNLQLYGQGGTDFRPAFAYVEELIKTRQLTNLQGILYFTDGYGIYPKKQPPFETAFIFLKEDYEDEKVPDWAIKLILEEKDLEEEQYEH